MENSIENRERDIVKTDRVIPNNIDVTITLPVVDYDDPYCVYGYMTIPINFLKKESNHSESLFFIDGISFLIKTHIHYNYCITKIGFGLDFWEKVIGFKKKIKIPKKSFPP